MTEPRSWLFVPADSERKIAKALDSEADAIIFDLEDSVAPAMKPIARDLLRNMLKRSGGPEWWVRVNPLGSEFIKDDLELIGIGDIHGSSSPRPRAARTSPSSRTAPEASPSTPSSPRPPRACSACSPTGIPSHRSSQ